MTNSEILDKFDVLYNNITSSRAPGLDGYEKSVFWNKATLEVLKNHLNPKGNKYGEGFDGSSKRQIEFSDIVVTATITLAAITTDSSLFNGIDKYKTTLEPDWSNVLSVLNEVVLVNRNGTVTPLVVVPINNTELDTLMSRPYKYPPRSQAWRFLTNGVARFVVWPNDEITQNGYRIRYVKVPAEVDLESNVNSEVPEVLHDEILQRAVELAKAAYVSDANQQQIIQALGERSE